MTRLPRTPANPAAPRRSAPRAFGFGLPIGALGGLIGLGGAEFHLPVLTAVFRFARPQQLCSWAGMTPRHRESDTKIHRGRITKQGNHLVRWAAVEAVQRVSGGPVGATRARLTERRGANIAKVAAARKLLTLVYYGLRDGHIRCLARPA